MILRKIIIPFVILLLPFNGLVNAQTKNSITNDIDKFIHFLRYIDRYYVDDVETGELVDKAILQVIKELDPHSSYIPSEELKKMREPLQGNFEGVGIQFNILNDTLYVISPISGGPSETVGVMAGDKIIKVDGENIAGIGLTNDDVFSLLRGEKGTKVTVSVLRRNVKQLIDFPIVRDKIPIFSIDATYMINDKTGYVKINRFSATTSDEFASSAKELRKQGAKNLILDLTGNGGGYLSASVELADQFLAADKMVVYTEGKNSPKRDYVSTKKGSFEKGEIIVLIDEGSASASEIVTGALQDWDRAIVIGRRSFGKGLVQREMMLPDKSAIRLTVAKYYTPTGRLIQKPYNEGLEEYHHEIYNRFNNGELISADSINFPDSLKYKTLVNNRFVYGGGGIMPDLFVPYDTSNYSDYYRDLIRKGLLNRFVLEYVDENRESILEIYPTFNEFKNYIVENQLLLNLIQYARDNDLEPVEEDIEISKEQMLVMIKAFIARDIYGRDEFFEIFNITDPIYQKALDIISDWDRYEHDLLN